MEEVELAITGMHCAACAHIEQKLSATAGVQRGVGKLRDLAGEGKTPIFIR